MVVVCAWDGDLDQCVFKGMAEVNPEILIPDFAFGKICPKGPQADKPAGGAAGGKFYVTPFRPGGSLADQKRLGQAACGTTDKNYHHGDTEIPPEADPPVAEACHVVPHRQAAQVVPCPRRATG